MWRAGFGFCWTSKEAVKRLRSAARTTGARAKKNTPTSAFTFRASGVLVELDVRWATKEREVDAGGR